MVQVKAVKHVAEQESIVNLVEDQAYVINVTVRKNAKNVMDQEK